MQLRTIYTVELECLLNGLPLCPLSASSFFVLSLQLLWTLSLRFNGHFPGKPGLDGVWSKGWYSMDLLTPSSSGVLPTLSLTTNSSWLPWGRVAMPLISPLMPVPQLQLLWTIENIACVYLRLPNLCLSVCPWDNISYETGLRGRMSN